MSNKNILEVIELRFENIDKISEVLNESMNAKISASLKNQLKQAGNDLIKMIDTKRASQLFKEMEKVREANLPFAKTHKLLMGINDDFVGSVKLLDASAKITEKLGINVSNIAQGFSIGKVAFDRAQSGLSRLAGSLGILSTGIELATGAVKLYGEHILKVERERTKENDIQRASFTTKSRYRNIITEAGGNRGKYESILRNNVYNKKGWADSFLSDAQIALNEMRKKFSFGANNSIISIDSNLSVKQAEEIYKKYKNLKTVMDDVKNIQKEFKTDQAEIARIEKKRLEYNTKIDNYYKSITARMQTRGNLKAEFEAVEKSLERIANSPQLKSLNFGLFQELTERKAEIKVRLNLSEADAQLQHFMPQIESIVGSSTLSIIKQKEQLARLFEIMKENSQYFSSIQMSKMNLAVLRSKLELLEANKDKEGNKELIENLKTRVAELEQSISKVESDNNSIDMDEPVSKPSNKAEVKDNPKTPDTYVSQFQSLATLREEAEKWEATVQEMEKNKSDWGSKQIEEAKKNLEEAKKQVEEFNKIKDETGTWDDVLQSAGNIGSEIQSWAGGIGNVLGALGLMDDDMGQVLSGAMDIGNALTSFASGDFLGAAASAISGVASLFDGLTESTEEKAISSIASVFDDQFSEDDEFMTTIGKDIERFGSLNDSMVRNIEEAFDKIDISSQGEFDEMSNYLRQAVSDYKDAGHTTEEAYEKFGDELSELKDIQERLGLESNSNLENLVQIQRTQTKEGRLGVYGEIVGSVDKMLESMQQYDFSAESYEGVFASMTRSFRTMQNAGYSMEEIFATMEPAYDRAMEAAESAGVSTDTLSEWGAYMERMKENSGLFDIITNLETAVQGMADIGILDEKSFSGMTSTANETLVQLQASGFSPEQIATQMGPMIASMQEAAEKYGLELPEQLKSVARTAEEMGIEPDMTEAESIQNWGKEFNKEFIGFGENLVNTINNLGGLAEGGLVEAPLGQRVLGWVHGGELVIPEGNQLPIDVSALQGVIGNLQGLASPEAILGKTIGTMGNREDLFKALMNEDGMEKFFRENYKLNESMKMSDANGSGRIPERVEVVLSQKSNGPKGLSLMDYVSVELEERANNGSLKLPNRVLED